MKKLKKKIFLFSGENLTMPKKTERRNPLGFSNIHSVAKHQKKCRGDPLRKKNFEKKIRKKCLAVPKKNERGDSLVSPGMICYAEKQVNSFWSSSLGQMVLFDTIIFCRTFKNYFGQFVWIEKKKKRVTIIVAFHFMKRRLKRLTQKRKLRRQQNYVKVHSSYIILTYYITLRALKKQINLSFKINHKKITTASVVRAKTHKYVWIPFAFGFRSEL